MKHVKEVRPTSGKLLLALFSILGNLEGAAFLDLFAGTGRVGLEALNRGASLVVMAEVLKNRAAAIGRSLPADAGASGKVVVLSLELRRALAWLAKREYLFGVIFADPPYNEGWGASLLEACGENMEKILKPGGVLAVEHSSREKLSVPDSWLVRDVRVYGESALTFLAPKRPPLGE